MSGDHEYMSSFLELGMALGVGFSLYVVPIRRYELGVERRIAAAEAYWSRSSKRNASEKRVSLRRLKFYFIKRIGVAHSFSLAISAGSILGAIANAVLIVLLGARDWILLGPHFGLVLFVSMVWYVVLGLLAWLFAKVAFSSVDRRLTDFHAE